MMKQITLEEIRHIFERQGLAREFLEQEPLLLWPRVAGAQMSRLTQPVIVRNGILFIEAANHVVAQQLSLMKNAYLNKLNAFLSEGRLADLRFSVRGSVRHPTKEAGEAEQLSLLEQENLEKLLDETSDPKLRETMRQLFLALAKKDRARATLKWKPCEVCGVHHDGGQSICYYCQQEGRTA